MSSLCGNKFPWECRYSHYSHWGGFQFSPIPIPKSVFYPHFHGIPMEFPWDSNPHWEFHSRARLYSRPCRVQLSKPSQLLVLDCGTVCHQTLLRVTLSRFRKHIYFVSLTPLFCALVFSSRSFLFYLGHVKSSWCNLGLMQYNACFLGGGHCSSNVIRHINAWEDCRLHDAFHDQSYCCHREEKTRNPVWHPLSERPRQPIHR